VQGKAAAAAVALAAVLLTAAPASARAPEAWGRRAVRVVHVQIPVPPDPGGIDGVLPTVKADVYIPSGAGRLPLVQLSHAWPGTLKEFPLSGWGRRLASRGFVVIVSDRRGGSTLAAQPSLDQPVDIIDLSSQVNSEDILRVVRWAIAQSKVSGGPLYRRVDPRRIAIGGHSLGAYHATFAAVKSQTEGPRLSALVLLDPSDERLGQNTLDSSLAQTPKLRIPTIDLVSEENQHPVMCNMDDGNDCTLVAPQQYTALSSRVAKLGVKVLGSVHEDVEDPSTIGTAASRAHLLLYQRYAMAWVEYWAGGDCGVAPYLGAAAAGRDARAGKIAVLPGAARVKSCRAKR
jgi:dienelactone hydrolase